MSPSCIREPPCPDLASWRGGWLHPAAKLGMKRTSFQYKMQKLGITRPY
jgi:hypothetical protein